MPFGLPPDAERAERLGAVLHVLYLIFNEGYAATAGPSVCTARSCRREAIRLARLRAPAAARRRRGGRAARA